MSRKNYPATDNEFVVLLIVAGFALVSFGITAGIAAIVQTLMNEPIKISVVSDFSSIYFGVWLFIILLFIVFGFFIKKKKISH